MIWMSFWWMMEMMIKSSCKRYIILTFLAFFAGLNLFAQQKDFQTWYEAELGYGLQNGIRLSGELEQRFQNNSTQYDRTQITLSASYFPLKYLKTSGGVRFLTAMDKDGRMEPGYRLHADASGRYSKWDVDFSLRFRLQYGFEEFIYFATIDENAFVNRYRLKAAYHIFGSRFDVFAFLEPWGLVNNLNGRYFKKMRYSAGGSYKLNFQSELGFRYILEDEFNRVYPMQSHIFVFSYFYNL